jgi:hypothetical protein
LADHLLDPDDNKLRWLKRREADEDVDDSSGNIRIQLIALAFNA